ncbi:uncharacterized protein LOC113766666 [Coffea eugenioides]|uniref:uncharacterized protein LOC113766666 n=1 Tax=Coffea eugenioides TaxID=49369 RepID=UPI000F607692|nr:uncharacterized protein LOC113766666 [Coffea eugenioides]
MANFNPYFASSSSSSSSQEDEEAILNGATMLLFSPDTEHYDGPLIKIPCRNGDMPGWKDYLGSLDDTHIPVSIPAVEQMAYTNRHGTQSQNVLAICDHDMRFIFVYAGWEGNAYDARVLEIKEKFTIAITSVFALRKLLLWYKEIIRSLTSAECEIFAMLCYAIWNNKNAALFNGKIRNPLSLVNLAAHSLREFHEANTQPIMFPPQTAQLRWLAPPSPHFKINFDAAMSTAQRIFGVGVVVRDHEGSFIASLAKKFVGSVILDKEDILSDLGLIIEDMRLALLDQHCIDVKYIPRKANKVAHTLANQAKNASFSESLWNAPPVFVKQIVLDDF